MKARLYIRRADRCRELAIGAKRRIWVALAARFDELSYGRDGNRLTACTEPPDENTAAAKGALAYFGTYAVSEADQTFTLHVERSLHPHISGTDQTRSYSIRGEEMKVTTPAFKYPKGTFTGYFLWARAK